MPSGTLPAEGSLGTPEISTGDFQAQINQLLAYVRSLQSEVAALSGTVIKEGAVRGVGDGASLLADKGVIDARLGTGGNLGSMAVKSSEDYLSSSTIPSIIWSDTPTSSITQSTLGDPGSGLYLVKVDTTQAGNYQAVIFWDGQSTVTGIAYHDTELRGSTPRSLATYVVTIGSTGIVTAKRVTYDANGDDGIGAFSADIVEVRKF